jgi:hypothetical protein
MRRARGQFQGESQVRPHGGDARGDAGSAGTGHLPGDAAAEAIFRGQLTGCGGLPYAGNACGDCLRQQCCDEAIDCANDPACLAKRACIARCEPGDVDCQGLCNSTIAYSDHAWFQLQQCMSARCTEDCPQACGVGLSAHSARCFQEEPALLRGRARGLGGQRENRLVGMSSPLRLGGSRKQRRPGLRRRSLRLPGCPSCSSWRRHDARAGMRLRLPCPGRRRPPRLELPGSGDLAARGRRIRAARSSPETR